MDWTITLVRVAYICLVNACIGLYIGHFGLNGFARPRQIALIIMFLAMTSVWLISYAQHKYGFIAQPNQIGVAVVFFVIGLFVGRGGRSHA